MVCRLSIVDQMLLGAYQTLQHTVGLKFCERQKKYDFLNSVIWCCYFYRNLEFQSTVLQYLHFNSKCHYAIRLMVSLTEVHRGSR